MGGGHIIWRYMETRRPNKIIGNPRNETKRRRVNHPLSACGRRFPQNIHRRGKHKKIEIRETFLPLKQKALMHYTAGYAQKINQKKRMGNGIGIQCGQQRQSHINKMARRILIPRLVNFVHNFPFTPPHSRPHSPPNTPPIPRSPLDHSCVGRNLN